MKRLAPATVGPSLRTPAVPALGRFALAVLAFAYGFAAVTIATRHGAVSTYAGSASSADVAELATGWALVATGLLATTRASSRRIGALVAAAGVAWFAGDWAGWETGPTVVRTVGFLGLGLVYALIVDATATWDIGARRERLMRVLVVAVYAVTAVLAVGRALVRDPFGDPHCWSDCTSANAFLIHSDRAFARALDFIDLRFAIASAAGLVGLVALRLARAAAPARRRLWPVLIPGAAFAAVHAAWAIVLLGGRTEDPAAAAFAALFAARCVALVALAVGLLWTLAHARATRAAIARVVDQFTDAPEPGSLETALAGALGDPSLSVAYWLSGRGCYVDADGRRVDAEPAGGKTALPITRAGRPVALVLHDSAVIDDGELVREIGATAQLAVDNERLAAEARFQLADLTASRARIVATADAERRRLERDLHDGAQQRLLALSYELRMALSAAREPELREDLSRAIDEAAVALDELRELAHGIYPAVLEESGLEPALKALANRAPLAVELELPTTTRAPAAAERAAYVAVDEAVTDATSRGASFVAVEVAHERDSLRLRIRDDGKPRHADLQRVVDRLGALGGSAAFGPATIEAEIPCA